MDINLTLRKSTKNTHVYSDDSEDAPMPSVYIKKSAFSGEPPPVIRLTMSVPTPARRRRAA
ncbi:MAG: hypothetical protein DRQ39_06615 [Gammaproteobacteria bacterium]|nr:MAG: hypothetical protein DRQ39_06615 [Gammaproteobacteria bacterium]